MYNESFKFYLNTIEYLAEICNFDELRNSLMRDRIVTAVMNAPVTKQLLNLRDLTLARCSDVCLGHFPAERQLSTVKNSDFVLRKLQMTKPPLISCFMEHNILRTRNAVQHGLESVHNMKSRTILESVTRDLVFI